MKSELRYHTLAARRSRIAAFFLDHFLASFSIAMIVLYFIELENEGELSGYYFNLLIGILSAFIFLYFGKDFFRGISFGKWMFGLMVRDEKDSNQVPSFSRLFLRNLFIIIWPVEFIMLLINDGKRLGDKIAKTIVIENPNRASRRDRFLVIVTLFLVVLTLLLFLIKNSEAYEVAIQEIEQNEEILIASGGINGYGYFPTGGIGISNGEGNADFNIKVYGNENNLSVFVQLIKERGGEWELIEMKFYKSH